MIHDLAGTLDVIDRAVLSVGATASLATALLVAFVYLITTALTGTWPRLRRDKTADQDKAA
ncbi:hypothetical protein ABZY90_19715 [Streptomyces sp. NPDC006422]|uniref:hypothetical protein n=1 Tax=unclassified Streptomyces TaxID=2593676 RepID=UPI00339FC90A